MSGSKLIYDKGILSAEALAVAESQLGVRETPNKANEGKQVNEYLKSVGLKPGYSWCQAFVFWCFGEAAEKLGIKNPVPLTAGVLSCWNKTATEQRITKADCIANPEQIKPGDQFIMNYGKGLGHTGIVEKVEGYILHTIEGNSNDEGSREGYEVCRRTRDINDKLFQGILKYSNV